MAHTPTTTPTNTQELPRSVPGLDVAHLKKWELRDCLSDPCLTAQQASELGRLFLHDKAKAKALIFETTEQAIRGDCRHYRLCLISNLERIHDDLGGNRDQQKPEIKGVLIARKTDRFFLSSGSLVTG